MKTYKVAILGATGAVGREMMKVLAERDFPIEELHPLASARSCLLYTSAVRLRRYRYGRGYADADHRGPGARGHRYARRGCRGPVSYTHLEMS